MAPDLNPVPRSSRPGERSTSSVMAPPPAPLNTSLPTSPRTASATMGAHNTGYGQFYAHLYSQYPADHAQVPLRHPRPLTPTELYLELEKEQEGIVNRLTRELSSLRAQTASVASTTSSNSELFTSDAAIVPTSARRHRSSSNLSTRSTRSINAAATNATSVSGVVPARETSVPTSTRPSMDVGRPDISRQNSAAGRRSVTASPSLSSLHGTPPPVLSQSYHTHPQRQSLNTQPSPVDSHTQHVRSPSFSAAVAAARYEEAAFHKAELDAVKRENELLRQRIKNLEKDLGARPNTAHTNAAKAGVGSATERR